MDNFDNWILDNNGKITSISCVHIVQVIGGKQPDGTPMVNKYMADGWYGNVHGSFHWMGPKPTPEAVKAAWRGGKAVFAVHGHSDKQ
jgi:hypothetical protein